MHRPMAARLAVGFDGDPVGMGVVNVLVRRVGVDACDHIHAEFACALIHTPEVLFLDEPTSGVDPVSRRDFWKILYELLRDGITLFVSTSYLDEAERCTRVALIDHGRILSTDDPGRMRKRLPLPMIEIATSRGREARSVIEGISGVKRVNVYGDRLHVALLEPGVVTNIEAAAKGLGIPSQAIRSIPSLEDVFIFMISELGARKEE